MKKFFEAVSLILLLALTSELFAACSMQSASEIAYKNQFDSSGPTGGDKEKTIRVATTFTGADPYTPVWQQVLKDFSVKYPGIKVVDEATSAAGDAFKTKINVDFASGNEPDVTYGFNGAIGKPICDSGKVITWEDELKADPTWASNFQPGPLESGRWQGKLYCLPYLGSFEGMWVNKDVFDTCGLQIPKTYEDIVKSIPILKAKNITPIVCSFSEEPHYIIETFLLAMGGKEGHARQFDASWAPALKRIKDLYEKGAFSEDALTIKQVSCAEVFAQKKAAMFISGSWSAGMFKDSQNTKVIPLPVVPGGKSGPKDIIGVAGTGWYLVKELNDKKDSAGMNFIKYMTSPGVIAKFVAVAGVSCIKTSVQADSPMKQSCIDLYNDATSVNQPIGDVMNQEAFTSIWKGLSYIVTGRKTAEQVLDEAKKLTK